MKKFALLLLAWFLVIVSVVAGSYIYSYYQAAEYDDRAVPYIRKAVPIISTWNPASTRALMAAETLEKIPEEEFDRIIGIFSRMGSLQSMETPSFKKVLAEEQTEQGSKIYVAYEVEASYSNGDALISMTLLEEDSRLEVYKFNLSSNTLVQ